MLNISDLCELLKLQECKECKSEQCDSEKREHLFHHQKSRRPRSPCGASLISLCQGMADPAEEERIRRELEAPKKEMEEAQPSPTSPRVADNQRRTPEEEAPRPARVDEDDPPHRENESNKDEAPTTATKEGKGKERLIDEDEAPREKVATKTPAGGSTSPTSSAQRYRTRAVGYADKADLRRYYGTIDRNLREGEYLLNIYLFHFTLFYLFHGIFYFFFKKQKKQLVAIIRKLRES